MNLSESSGNFHIYEKLQPFVLSQNVMNDENYLEYDMQLSKSSGTFHFDDFFQQFSLISKGFD